MVAFPVKSYQMTHFHATSVFAIGNLHDLSRLSKSTIELLTLGVWLFHEEKDVNGEQNDTGNKIGIGKVEVRPMV